MGFAQVLEQIRTVARHTILQALRMKLALVLLAFLLVLLVAMPYVLKSDQTHVGQAKIVLTYSSYLIAFILSVLTLLLSASSLWTEVKGRQILMLDTKPISRGTILLGKWVGIMAINCVLVVVMYLAVYLLLVFWVGRPMPRELPRDYEVFRAKVFTARRTLRPTVDPSELMRRVNAVYNMYKQKGWLPKDRSEQWVRMQIMEQVGKEAWNVPSNAARTWVVEGIPDFRGWLVVNFRHFAPVKKANYTIIGRFTFNEHGNTVVRIPQEGMGQNFKGAKLHTFAMTPKVVEDGKLEITYENRDPEGLAAQFPFVGGMEVQYPVAGWLERFVFSSQWLAKLVGKSGFLRQLVDTSGLFSNFVSAGLILLWQLTFLSIVGIFASTFLGFPVAVMGGATVCLVGMLRVMLFTKMLPKLYIFGDAMRPPWATINQADTIVRMIIGKLFSIFPSFTEYDTVPYLATGMHLEALYVWNSFVSLVLIRGLVLALFAWLIFRRRELATFSPNA